MAIPVAEGKADKRGNTFRSADHDQKSRSVSPLISQRFVAGPLPIIEKIESQ